jgi:hypothetical protein
MVCIFARTRAGEKAAPSRRFLFPKKGTRPAISRNGRVRFERRLREQPASKTYFFFAVFFAAFFAGAFFADFLAAIFPLLLGRLNLSR